MLVKQARRGAANRLRVEPPARISAIGDTLDFDLPFDGSTNAGLFGLDQIVVSLLDSASLDPLGSGLTEFGDVFALDAKGYSAAAGVTVSPTTAVPAQGAVALVAIGLGCVGTVRRRFA